MSLNQVASNDKVQLAICSRVFQAIPAREIEPLGFNPVDGRYIFEICTDSKFSEALLNSASSSRFRKHTSWSQRWSTQDIKKAGLRVALLDDASASVPVRGLSLLIKLLEKNAISEIGEAESEAVSIFLTGLLDQART